MQLRKSYFEMIKYGITGVFGTVLYFAVMMLLVEVLHLPPTIASCLAFCATIATSFFINNFWTFNAKDASLGRFIRYSIVSIIGLILTTVITYVGVELLGIWYLYTQIVVVVVVPLSNYLLNRQWVFAIPEDTDSECSAGHG